MLAWITGEGIVVYRWVKLKAPPPPGALMLSSGIFVGLAFLGQYEPARGVATVTAWALDLAILLQVVGKAPTGKTGWPPPLIDDPTTILPSGASSKAGATKGTADTVGTSGGATSSTPTQSAGGGSKNPVTTIIGNIWDSLK